MDQDEEDYETVYQIRAARHDRFSVLVPLLQAASAAAGIASRMLNTYSIMAIQQSMIKEYDREFNRITEGL